MRYLNVDLELVSSSDLEPLLTDLASATIMLRDSIEDGSRTVWLELARESTEPDAAIVAFARIVDSLPHASRGIWDACADRCLNVGLDRAPAPHPSAVRISSAAVAAMARIQARLEFTVYEPGDTAALLVSPANRTAR